MKKKVEDCTIKELEKWFIKKHKFIPSHIKIGWYDVIFYSVDEERENKQSKSVIPKFTEMLYKGEEIEVD